MRSTVALLVPLGIVGCVSVPEAPPAANAPAPLAVSGPQVIEPPNARPRVIYNGNAIGGNGHAQTWDGRLFIGSFGGSWSAVAFRPEALALDGGTTDAGTPNFARAFSDPDGGVLDPVVLLPSPSPRPVSAVCPTPPPRWPVTFETTTSGVVGKNALAILPDRRYPTNPYRCGSDDCYELILVTLDVAPPVIDFGVNGGINQLGQFRARVIVANPGTPAATVRSTEITDPFQPYHISRWRDVNGVLGAARDPIRQRDDRLVGIEPTVTIDGRLMVWNGSVSNDTTDPCGAKNNSFLVYSWNENPDDLNGWTEPADVPRMYLDADQLVAGVPFAQRFPIAAQRMKRADGTPFPSPGPASLFGAYPWLSLDGTELLFPAVPQSQFETNDGATRSGVSMIGRFTGWALRHLDGPINSSRVDNRLFYSSPGAKPSFWTPYRTLRDPTRPLPIPYTAGRPVYPFFGSNSKDYSEVSLEDTVDGDYVLSLHMNEMLLTNCDGNGCGANTYDFRRTPDTSGNANTGTLSGAIFPGEDRPGISADTSGCDDGQDNDQNGKVDCLDPGCYGLAICKNAPTPNCNDCNSPSCFDADLGLCMARRPIGFVGQAIKFHLADSIDVGNAPSLVSSAPGATNPDLTVELAVWPGIALANGYLLAQHPGRWSLAVDGAGNLVATVVQAGGAVRSSTPVASVPVRAWTHVAFTYEWQTGWLRTYVNGSLRSEQPVGAGALHAPLGNLLIGPNAGGSGPLVLVLDEVKVSRVARTAVEIARSAFVRPATVALGNESYRAHLPAGLEVQDLRVPADNPYDASQVALGQQLFFDRRLSRSGQLACADCHQQPLGLSDDYATGRGLDGRPLLRRSSAAHNRAFGWAQFWDGRAASVEEQVIGPLQNPNEMGLSIDEALALVRETPQYAHAFGDGNITTAALQRALAQFVRSLITGGAAADIGPLGDAALRGRALFTGKARCTACHSGSNYTDELFHATRTANDAADLGRGKVTGRSVDQRAFKTASLRDVALRHRYLHDGSVTDLTEVVRRYNQGGLPGFARDPEIRPLGLSDGEIGDLVAFLQSLTGTMTAVSAPPLWARTPSTTLRNPSFAADLSYWTVVGGYYQLPLTDASQSWLATEPARSSPESGLVRLAPTPAQPAYIEQTLTLPASPPHSFTARVSQLLNNGGTVELVLQRFDGGWVDVATTGAIDFGRGWVTVGATNDLTCPGGWCGSHTVTLRVTARTSGNLAAPGISDIQLY